MEPIVKLRLSGSRGILMKTVVLLLIGLQLSGCCGGLKEAIRGYGIAAESSAETTAELVKRCKAAATESNSAAKESELAACDQALKSLDSQRTAAGQLKTIE